MRQFAPLLAVALIGLFILGLIGTSGYFLVTTAWEMIKTAREEAEADAQQQAEEARKRQESSNRNRMQSLQQARAVFPTQVVMQPLPNAPRRPPNFPDVGHWKALRYGRENNGTNWLGIGLPLPLEAEPLAAENRLPAVILVRNDDAGVTDETLAVAEIFRKRGFFTAIPSFRGENGNMGLRQFCYSEVNELAEVYRVVREQPQVDPNRIYFVGAADGATLLMLLAVSGVDEVAPRAFIAVTPTLDFTGTGLPITRFLNPVQDPHEIRFRSVNQYLTALRVPAVVITETTGKAFTDLGAARAIAARNSLPLFAFPLPNLATERLPRLYAGLADHLREDAQAALPPRNTKFIPPSTTILLKALMNTR